MQQLSVFCPSLQELNLRDCKQLTDMGVAYLSHLNRLKTLNISVSLKPHCIYRHMLIIYVYISDVNNFLSQMLIFPSNPS
jgi:hypothetical protein